MDIKKNRLYFMETKNKSCLADRMKRKLLKVIKSRQVRHFGHIRAISHFIKIILEAKIEGRQTRGRQ